MKKLLSILLAALLLCGVMGVGLSAAAAPDFSSLLLKPLTDFLANYDLANLTDGQTQTLIGILNTLKALGIDYKPFLAAAGTYFSAALKQLLQEAGLMDFPGLDLPGLDLPGLGSLPTLTTDSSSVLKQLTNFLASADLANLTDAQLELLIGILNTLKKAGVNYVPLLEAVDGYLPFAVKAALHDAGLMNYPIWERDFVMYLIFKYLLFGWLWMEPGNSPLFPLNLFA